MAACYAVFAVVGRIGYFTDEVLRDRRARREDRGRAGLLYECYLRGLPFYLGETVGLVSPHSDDLRLGRITRHDPRTFLERGKSSSPPFRGDGRVFVVLRRQELETLQDRRRAPAVDPGVVAGHVLISNRPGSRRSRELRALLDAGGAGARRRLRTLRPVAARWVVTMIEFRGPGRRADLLLEPGARRRDTVVSFAIAAPPRMTARAGSSAPRG